MAGPAPDGLTLPAVGSKAELDLIGFSTSPADPPQSKRRKARRNPSERHVFEALVEEFEAAGGAFYDPSRGAWFKWGSEGWRRSDQAVLETAWKRETNARWTTVRGALVRAEAVNAVREADEPDPLDPPGLVGFPDGTLWDGSEMRWAEPEDMVTRRTAATPSPSSDRWAALVLEWCSGDETASRALQAAFGIALLGRTHRRFLVFEGPRRSGKTTFLDAIARAFGDYAAPISSRLFIAGDDHETLVASLAGARFAWADEAPAGRSIATERLKALTGGGTVSARFMRRDHFSFEPRALLALAANDIPFLRTPG